MVQNERGNIAASVNKCQIIVAHRGAGTWFFTPRPSAELDNTRTTKARWTVYSMEKFGNQKLSKISKNTRNNI